ncbi:MAG: bifunctional riboflavin kinase/FAD synthetase [Eubacteriales bacterium]|nr:bifunctional riboflavin kinase/FAD synthetase [Eubacteriales bacterium]
MTINDIFQSDRKNPIVIALGFFDCVHIGHRKLIEETKQLAKKMKAESAVFTFNTKESKFKKSNEIYNFFEREYILDELGVDRIVYASLNDEFASLSGDSFLKLLFKNFHIVGIVCGADYRYGKNAKSNVSDLAEFAAGYNAKVIIENFVTYEGEKVSTTMLADILSYGDLSVANELLGEPYFILNKVESDFKRGRKFGCPTINVHVDNKVKLRDGVYATIFEFEKQKYASITNVGTKPTFNDSNYTVETHVLNFNREIYGELVKVSFLKYIRPIRKFSSPDELKKQIDIDAQVAQKIFNSGENK